MNLIALLGYQFVYPTNSVGRNHIGKMRRNQILSRTDLEKSCKAFFRRNALKNKVELQRQCLGIASDA